MTYVHLANGEVKQMDDKEFSKAFGDDVPRVFRDNGQEHTVIGVYPDEVEYDQTDDEKAANAENEEFQQWKRDRDSRHDSVESDSQNVPPDDNEGKA